MDKQRCLRRAVLAAVLGVYGAGGVAQTIPEIELNQSINQAQKLSITGGGATVTGVIGNLTGSLISDRDYYSFDGTAGMVVTFDINGAWKDWNPGSVDTILTVFGPGNTYEKLRENDNCENIELDSCIVNFVVEASGLYTVAVTSAPCRLGGGGGWLTGSTCTPWYNGSYTLVITVLSTADKQINIEIKPGSRELAPVNPKSKGKIPVALLSSADFNALDVDVALLTFGATGNEKSLSRCNKEGQDVNGDGRLDLVCHFENHLAEFDTQTVEGIVRGKTADGSKFEGRGLLKVVPPVKRQH